jgi:hypothetical protein
MRVSVTTVKQMYAVSCKDCPKWHLPPFAIKRNADTAMMAHRIMSHGYKVGIMWKDRKRA